MAAVYTVHTGSIRILNCLCFPDSTLKTYYWWLPYTFSASQIDCTPLDSQMRVSRHHTGASPVFFNMQLVDRGRDRLTILTMRCQPWFDVLCLLGVVECYIPENTVAPRFPQS